MKNNLQSERQKKVKFAVGMASIDGGKPSVFTKKLLSQYEKGQISSNQLKESIVKNYTKAY